MNLKKTSHIIIAYILLFPPTALLLYAITSYVIFFNFQQNISNDILHMEKKTINQVSKKAIKSKAITLNRILNRQKDIKHFFEDIRDIQSINSPDHIDVLILDKKKQTSISKKLS